METRTVFTMASSVSDRLANFKCQVGGRYPVSQEWCLPDEHPRAGLLDVRKALDNLEDFIIDVC